MSKLPQPIRIKPKQYFQNKKQMCGGKKEKKTDFGLVESYESQIHKKKTEISELQFSTFTPSTIHHFFLFL